VKIEFSRTFAKDLEAILDIKSLTRFEAVIAEVERAESLSGVRNLRRLKGHPGFFRIRVGHFRIGFKIVSDTAIFLRCLPRKEIYRRFP
jgi:mRNA interferase RelE/StbE